MTLDGTSSSRGERGLGTSFLVSRHHLLTHLLVARGKLAHLQRRAAAGEARPAEVAAELAAIDADLGQAEQAVEALLGDEDGT
jgi:hypothetical protein